MLGWKGIRQKFNKSKSEKSKSILFDFSSSLSTLNGLSYNSKSEKSKSILFDFSTFRLFFPLDSQRFKLKFKKWKVKKYTFRLFDFSSSLSTLNGLVKIQKVKSILFDVSTFWLFFPLDSQRFKLKFKKWKVKKYTFRLFFFPLDFQRFKLKIKKWKVKKYTFRLFHFLIFRLFLFPLDSQRFKLKFKKWKVKK